jgi:transcriptional regulator GlxA family with amidase domain
VQSLTPLAGAKLVMDVLSSLGESFEKEHKNDPQSILVRKAQELIFENLESNMGIMEIADMLQVSREHLSRVFKAQAGVSPVDYILNSKMKFACHLLKNTNLSCKEIAERVGYDNPSSFNRAFKKTIRITPNELRRIGYAPNLNV